MTEPVTVAVIGNATIIAALVLSRIMSHFEHKKTEEVAKKIHSLVNSALAGQLRVSWLRAKRIAELTKSPTDEATAQEAQWLYEEHMRQQALIDAIKNATNSTD